MLMANAQGKLIDVGRYFDGAVRRVVAEWRRPGRSIGGGVRKLELECGHFKVLNTRIPSTLASFITAPLRTFVNTNTLVRVPVNPDGHGRASRVCTQCREIYVQKRLSGEIRYIGE